MGSQSQAAADGGIRQGVSFSANRPFRAAPIDTLTYRSLLYIVLAFPLSLVYFIALSIGVSMTLGLSVTLLGPIAAIATLISIVAFAWFDGQVTNVLLQTETNPSLPDTDAGTVPFLKSLILGRQTWFGAIYLLWRIIFGFVGFLVLIVGVSLATAFVLVPFTYGEQLVIYGLGMDPIVINTLPRALITAVGGFLVGIGTLYVINLLGRVSVRMAETFLSTES